MGFIHICIVLESYVDLEYKISVQFCSVGSPCLLFLGLRDYNVCQITCVTPSDKCNKRQASVSLVSLTKSENIFKSVFYSSVMLMSLLKIGQLSSFFFVHRHKKLC